MQTISYEQCKQMSSRLIAMNNQRNGNKGQIATYILDYYTELTKQPWLAQLVGQIRDLTQKQQQMLVVEQKEGEDEVDLFQKAEAIKQTDAYKQLAKQVESLKKQLPFRSPHYFHFLDNHRAQKAIAPESFTFQTTVDIDDPDEVEDAVKRALLLNGFNDGDMEVLFREKMFKPEDIELWRGKV